MNISGSSCLKNFTVMNTGNYLFRIITILCGFWLLFNTGLLAGSELHALPKAVNAAPILGKIESTDLIYQKASGRANITSSITITDADSKNLRSASIRITDGYHADEDILYFRNQNGINGVWNKSTGILTLTGSASRSRYQTALRSIQYENTNVTDPSTDKRKVTFTVNDGLSNSNTVSRNIIVFIPNLAPVLGGLENAQIIYCVNSGGITITSTLAVSDGDDENLSSAKIQIITNYTRDEDFLRFTDQNGIIGSWDASGGILTLTGQATKANYQDALRSIRYENTNAENPVKGLHSVSFVVNDGKDFGNAVSRGIYVNGPVRAVLMGTATLCSDELTDMPLQIDFKGTPPWNFTLTRDNGNEKNYDHINEDPYSFSVNQQGTYRIKSLSDANCSGDTTGSGSVKITFKTPPTALLSGVDTICTGLTAELSIALTGIAPWSITYYRNGSNSIVISNINTSDYKLKVTSAGTYTLSAVTDAVCTNGKVSGIATVIQLSAPAALLSGDASICENTSAELNVGLTGTAPWRFSYKKDNGTPVNIQDANASPKIIAVNQAGNYTLYEVFDKYCKGTVSGLARISVRPSPDVSISGLAPAYNKEDNQMVLITGTPAGGRFSGPGLFYSSPDWFFLPGYAPLGTLNIVYAYQESEGSCFGYDTAVIKVLEASGIIEFPENRTTICQNEGAFTIKGVNLNNSNGRFSISGDNGLINNGDNTATIDPHGLVAGKYTITYTYTDGAIFSVKKTFEIGAAPVADFKCESECFDPGQSVGLKNASSTTFGNINGFLWTIKAEGRKDTLTTQDIEYTFPDEGRYDICLSVKSSYGCANDIAKTIGLSSPIKLAGQSFHEDFEDSSLYWHAANLPSNPVNSWVLSDTSQGFPRTKSGHLFWHTDVNSVVAPVEDSWVTSPCFDFSGTEKPMVILDVWRKFNNLRDGAVMQATSDSGKTWNNVGELDDGVNWFNNYSISGKPGEQSVGWADIQENDWKESRHDLDMLKGKSRVQFRIAYGSDGTALNTDGIAFDNFRISERDRTALLEHFTNSADSSCKAADVTLNNMVSTDSMDLVDLQYHTSFPGVDPFNAQEPYVPSSRLLYYGLQNVPYTILNGGTDPSNRFDHDARKLKWKPIRVESLEFAKFGIRIYSELINNNALYITTSITALADMPNREYTIHVGVIERKITIETGTQGKTEFRNVIKAFLPDPAGNIFFRAWNVNDVDSVKNYWYLQNVYNPNELKVFAFIQDESTSEVYQVAMNKIDFATGIKDLSSSENLLLVYPNPANNAILVKLDKPAKGTVSLNIYNNLGVLVKTVEIPGTADKTEISTSLFPDGIYIIRALSGTSLLGTQKLNVSH
jgi:hypothetical protein